MAKANETSSKYSNRKDKGHKLERLPDNYKIQKRPLVHPPIASPYSGSGTAKIVFLSSKTPFMSAMKRVRQLLKQVDKRAMQSEVSKSKARRKSAAIHVAASVTSERAEEVLIKATGKAIDKALNLALFFQGQQDCIVRINTGTVDAIDDLVKSTEVTEPAQDARDTGAGESRSIKPVTAAHDLDLPEARIRHASMIEIFVSLRA